VTTTQQALGVLYIIACGSRPAGDLSQLVQFAQRLSWDVCVIATPSGLKFLDPDPGTTLFPARGVMRPPVAVTLGPSGAILVNRVKAGTHDRLTCR